MSIGDVNMEEWREIPGWEGLYEVSNMGNVRSLDRRCSSGKFCKGQILAKRYDNSGYTQVGLCRSSTVKWMKVHRLVAMAFLPNPENKPQVNHLNGIRDDNRLGNLEWCTCSENHRHAFDVLGKKPSRSTLGKPAWNRKLNEEQIKAILADTRSQSKIAKDYGVCQQTISNLKNGLFYNV